MVVVVVLEFSRPALLGVIARAFFLQGGGGGVRIFTPRPLGCHFEGAPFAEGGGGGVLKFSRPARRGVISRALLGQCGYCNVHAQPAFVAV